jgi:eukaryotic-like serine/threonine-protein kinase
MKKFFPIIISLMLVLSACGGPGGAQPTAVALPTAASEPTKINAPQEAQAGKAGDERTSEADGMAEVFIPSGKFQMGGFDDDAQKDEHPTHGVTMGAFWMDKVEVTNAMYQLCVLAGACQAPRDIKSATRSSYFANKDFADYPVVYVSWQDAANYCKWAGRRMPTEAEWEYAARGSADFRRYPWGEQSPDNNLANFDNQARDTTRVGSFPKGASAFGLLDMAGNVWEWVSDFYGAGYYGQTSAENPTGPGDAGANAPKVMRGGSWADNFKEVRVSNRGFAKAPDLTADSKSDAFKGDANNRIGFRCAANGK